MREFFRNRSIFFQLLIGGLSIIGGVALVTLLVNTYFQHQSERANARRWIATSIALKIRQVRQDEKDFLFREFYTFLDDGTPSPALADIRKLLPAIKTSIDSVTKLSNAEQRLTDRHLRAAVDTYTIKFEERLRINIRRGVSGNTGLGGVMSKNYARIDTLIRNAKIDLAKKYKLNAAYVTLRRLQSTAVNSPDSTRTMLLDSGVVAKNTLIQAAPDLPGVTGALARIDSALPVYHTLNKKMGFFGDTSGLRGEMKRAAGDMESLIQRIIESADRDSRTAQRRLALATPIILVIELVLAGLFFYWFARWLSAGTARLADVAAKIGRGDLNARASVSGTNELGKLADEFNHMVESLGTLVSAVQESGEQINHSVVEIAATAQEQKATANEVAATTSQVGTTAREISATSQELAANMEHVAVVAAKTALLAGSGQSGLGLMESTMQQITHASEAISVRLGALSEKAQNITTVVTTITKVADQTNLLSLNAAIEAEKAGEYGRGFAVVATEIRRLADQTAAATSDIEQIVEEMQSAVTAGVMGMDKFSDEVRRGAETGSKVGDQLSEIIQHIRALTPNFDIVNHGMQSQAEGAQQISESLGQLGVVAYQTAESLAQSSLSIDQLNEASRRLQQGVAKFALVTS